MSEIKIMVNGKNIPLSEFPEDIIRNVTIGMLKSLKGVDEINSFKIEFEK